MLAPEAKKNTFSQAGDANTPNNTQQGGGNNAPPFLQQMSNGQPTLPSASQGGEPKQGEQQQQFTPKDGNTPQPVSPAMVNPVADPKTAVAQQPIQAAPQQSAPVLQQAPQFSAPQTNVVNQTSAQMPVNDPLAASVAQYAAADPSQSPEAIRAWLQQMSPEMLKQMTNPDFIYKTTGGNAIGAHNGVLDNPADAGLFANANGLNEALGKSPTPFSPAPAQTQERYMINGETLLPDGKMAPSAMQQQRTIGDTTTPFRNYDATNGVRPAPSVDVMKQLAAASAANKTMVPGGSGTSPTNTGAGPTLGAGNGTSSSGSSPGGSPVSFQDFGKFLEQLMGNPSAYDDKTMNNAIANNEGKLKSAEEEGMAGVDADTAARGLLMGSPNVIDKTKVRNKIQQARGDFDTNISLDRAHTMASDRNTALQAMFSFINAGQAQQGQDFNWAQLAALMGQAGAPDQNAAAGSIGTPSPAPGGIDWNAIGQMFTNRNNGGK